MAKLAPPIIEGVIPAAYGDRIIVPYTMSKSVNKNQIKGFSLKIKTVQSNRVINTISTNYSSDNEAVFKFTIVDGEPTVKLNPGQFYKIQLAYIDNSGVVGNYSTIGVVKYTTEPILKLDNNENSLTYIGTYDQTKGDATEKVYTYRFDLTDDYGNLIMTTGDKLHNSSEDTEHNFSSDIFILNREIKNNSICWLTYSVTTINGLKSVTSAKRVHKHDSISSALEGATILATLNREEGYIDVSLKGALILDAEGKETEVEKSVVGSFILLRSSSEDNFETWDEVLHFVLHGQQPSRHLWKDMTVQQGVSYKYAIQQYNIYKLKSNKIESTITYADFDYAFLYDGDRQLKIKYNPKITSFKNTMMEAKVDTIGSKYPFIFRNGSVNYKEFPISGLISYLSDDNALFMEREISEEISRPRLSAAAKPVISDALDNIQLERQFKLKVLEWLTDGKPKLFRSPTEGNYIVRLLNVSLSPNDTLGRMLHTFNCTAYEIAESDYSSLNAYNFIRTADPTTEQLRWATVELRHTGLGITNVLKHDKVVSIHIEGAAPGTPIVVRSSAFEDNEQTIIIGATGTYSIDLGQNIEITFVGLNTNTYQGTLTYGYYSNEFKDSFDLVNAIEVVDVPCRQFIGKQEDIISQINNVKNQMGAIGFLHFYLRRAEESIFKHGSGSETYYTFDIEGNGKRLNLNDTMDIYQVYSIVEFINNNSTDTINVFKYISSTGVISYYNNINYTKNVDVSNPAMNYVVWDYEWIDGYNDKSLGKDFNSDYTMICVNNETYNNINIMDTSDFYVRNPDNIQSLSIGDAIICEISYRNKEISYELETSDQDLINTREQYELKLSELKTSINTIGTTRSALIKLQDECINLYNQYLNLLEIKIKQKERR